MDTIELNSVEHFDEIAKTIPQVAMLDQDIPSQSNIPHSSHEKQGKFVLPKELESPREEEKCQHCGGTCRHTPNTSKDKYIPSMRVKEESSKGPSSHTNLTDAAYGDRPNIQVHANCCSHCGYGGASSEHMSSAKVRSGSIPISGESMKL